MAQKAYSLSHTKWMCKYHIVFTPKYRRKVGSVEKVGVRALAAPVSDIRNQLIS